MLRSLLLFPLSFARIVGGEAVSPETYKQHFSAVASLQFGGFHECGAVLITPEQAITAAHCIANYTQEMVRENETLLIGSPDISDDAGKERIPVLEYRLHPGYDPENYKHDIAWLKLARPSRYRPVVIDETMSEAGTEVFAAGWGRTEISSESSVLRSVRLSQVSLEECRAIYGESFPVFDENVCAFALIGDACHGDSGGPLFRGEGDSSKLLGLVSWGIGCGDGFPGVYTRVSAYNILEEGAKWPLGVGSNAW